MGGLHCERAFTKLNASAQISSCLMLGVLVHSTSVGGYETPSCRF